MEKISIYPDKKLKERLEQESKKEGRSLNNFVLRILKKYFKLN